jgi:hypothetical protein
MMNGKGFGMKRSSPNFKVLLVSGLAWRDREKLQKTSVKIVGLRAEI